MLSEGPLVYFSGANLLFSNVPPALSLLVLVLAKFRGSAAEQLSNHDCTMVTKDTFYPLLWR